MLRIALLSVLWLALLPDATLAQQKLNRLDQPMQVVQVRSSEKGCEPRCPEWLMAQGRITPETPALILKAVQSSRGGGGAALPLVLNSPGGNILPALQMGYYLRAQGVTVAVGATRFEGCDPFRKKACKPKPSQGGVYRGRAASDGAICLSACPILLASGVKRLVSPDTIVAVHHWGIEPPEVQGNRPKSGSEKLDPAWDKVVRKMITDYLTQMGNSLDMVEIMDRVPYTSFYRISPRRRLELGLVTDAAGIKGLAGRAACRAETRPDHCRSRPAD